MADKSVGDIATGLLTDLQSSKIPLFKSLGNMVSDTEDKLAIKYIEDNLPIVITAILIIFFIGFFIGKKR